MSQTLTPGGNAALNSSNIVIRVCSGTNIRAIEKKEPSWSEIINALDTRHLLDYLAYHYALNTDSLRIERNKSGHERIADDGRRYSLSDFLTRRMNMTWPEARMVLQTIHAQQQTVEQRQRAVNSKLLWHRFERYEKRLPGITAIRADYRKRREAILAESRFQPDATLSKAQNAVKRRLLRERRRTDLEQLKQNQEAELRYYRQRPHDRFLEYLYEQAKKGMGQHWTSSTVFIRCVPCKRLRHLRSTSGNGNDQIRFSNPQIWDTPWQYSVTGRWNTATRSSRW